MSGGDVYRRAVDVIHERGWWQGDSVDPRDPDEGPVCLYGAINVARGMHATTIDPHSSRTARRVLVAAGVATTTAGDIGAWNDALGRTADDVVFALKRAAEVADVADPALPSSSAGL